MSDDNMNNHSDGQMTSSGHRRGSMMPWFVLLVVIVIIVGAGVMFRDRLFPSIETAALKNAKVSGYQAVFLTNGQVYFGKLSRSEEMYVTLKDIYYLQVTQPPLQGSQQNGAQQQTAAQQQISLVKLGSELHGPVDSMQINREQILFFEDMKADGKVAQAITEYQKNPPATPSTNSQAPTNQIPATQTPESQTRTK